MRSVNEINFRPIRVDNWGIRSIAEFIADNSSLTLVPKRCLDRVSFILTAK